MRRIFYLRLRKGWLLNELAEKLNVANFLELDRMNQKRKIDEYLYEEWQCRWDHSEQGRVTHEFIREVELMRNKSGAGLSKCLMFLITGHGPFNSYLFDRSLHHSAKCMCGHEKEDWKHILVDCHLYNDIRNLKEFNINKINEEIVFEKALFDENSLRNLNSFAAEVFKRRGMLMRSAEDEMRYPNASSPN